MSWLVTFLAYVRMIPDQIQQDHLYRQGIYHIWDLQRVLGEDPGLPTSWPVRAQLAIWREMIHIEYLAFIVRWATTTNRDYNLSLCQCAFCVPPAYGNVFQPGAVWSYTSWAGLTPECPCFVGLRTDASFPGPSCSAGPSTSVKIEPSCARPQQPTTSASYQQLPLEPDSPYMPQLNQLPTLQRIQPMMQTAALVSETRPLEPIPGPSTALPENPEVPEAVPAVRPDPRTLFYTSTPVGGLRLYLKARAHLKKELNNYLKSNQDKSE